MRIEKFGALKFTLFIILAWLIVLLTRLIPVGGDWIKVDQFTWVIFNCWVIVYFSSIFLGIFWNIKETRIFNKFPSSWQNCWVERMSFLSIVGAILIVFEFAITRGYGFSTPVAAIRQIEVAAASAGFEGSWVSGIGRILTPALIVAWILAVLGWSELSRRNLILLSISSAMVLYQQMMFEGGRFYLAALLMTIFLAKCFANKFSWNKVKIEIKILPWSIIFILVFSIFGYMFIERYQQSNRDFTEAYENWAANFDLEINEEIISRISGNMGSFWLAVCMMWAYLTQGINELNSLLVSSTPDLAWGSMQFPQIAQALNKLTGLQLKYDELQNLPKIGTYITLYGASYVDFGYVGAFIFIGLIGWFTGKSIRLLYSQRFDGLSINAPLLITLGVFSPIVSLVVTLWPAFFWALFVGFALKKSACEINKKATLV